MEERLRQLIEESGAVAMGIAGAAPVDEAEWSRFETWLAAGMHAGMTYMENHKEIRRDPRLLLEGAQTVISVAYNYRQSNPVPGVATYALGEDYHKVLRRRLKAVVRAMKAEYGGEWRICIDSAPILERYWAERCGVGRRSPVHGNIVVEGVGSMVFLAEVLTTLRVRGCEGVRVRGCGGAGGVRGIQEERGPMGVCPTGALMAGGMVDARRCINYLTIEKKGTLSEEERRMVGRARFGCDLCQRSSAENQGPARPVIPEFRPLPGLEAFLDGDNPDFPLSRSPLARGIQKEKIKNN